MIQYPESKVRATRHPMLTDSEDSPFSIADESRVLEHFRVYRNRNGIPKAANLWILDIELNRHEDRHRRANAGPQVVTRFCVPD
jgi:hypothetical protein